MRIKNATALSLKQQHIRKSFGGKVLTISRKSGLKIK
jgi:hypothetical protein